MAEKVFEEM